MRALAFNVWQILLLRQGPQGMPTAPLFAATLAAANVTVSLLISRSLDNETSVAATLTLMMVSIATQACLVYLALWLRGVPNRFVPTFSALLACDLVLTLVAGIGFLTFTDTATLGYQLFSVIYLIWSLGVNGWISLPIGREDPSLYFVIQSKSAETQTLVGATSPRCESIAIRRTAVVDGQWSSVGMPEGMAVPAGGAVAFAPRGLFLRMSGAEKFAEGDAVPVELEFASGLKVAFTATAKDE